MSRGNHYEMTVIVPLHVCVSCALVVQGCRGIHSNFPGQGAIAYSVIGDAISVYRATCALSALDLKRMSIHIVRELVGMAAHQVDGGIGLGAREAWSGKDVVIESALQSVSTQGCWPSGQEPSAVLLNWFVGVRRVVDVGNSTSVGFNASAVVAVACLCAVAVAVDTGLFGQRCCRRYPGRDLSA